MFTGAEEEIPETSYYKDYLILHGRWVRISQSQRDLESMSLMRFAAVDNPLQVMETCLNVFVKEGIIQLPISKDDYDRVAPEVGYSSYTASYPIYFYAKIHERSERHFSAKIHERYLPEYYEKDVAQLIVGSNNQSASDEESHADLMLKTQLSQARKSQTDVKDSIFDGVVDLLGAVVTTHRFTGIGNRIVEPVLFLSGSINDLWKYSYACLMGEKAAEACKKVPTTSMIDKFAIPILNASLLGEGYWKKSYPLAGVNLVAAGLWASYKSFLHPIFSKSSEDLSQGYPLDAVHESLDYKEFVGSKLAESPLVCQYFANSGPAESMHRLFSITVPSQVGVGNIRVLSVPTEIRGGHETLNGSEAGGGLSIVMQAVNTSVDSSRKNIILRGRWTKTENGEGFATLADPTQLFNTCLRALERADLIPSRVDKNRSVAQIVVSTGNKTDAVGDVEGHPLIHYIPLIVKGGMNDAEYHQGVFLLNEALIDVAHEVGSQ